MPYTTRKVGDQYCVYKKDGEKVGCTDGNKEALRRYLAALHINAQEGVEGVGPLTELSMKSVGVRDLLRKIFRNPELMKALQFNRFRDVVDTILHSHIEEFEELKGEVEAWEADHKTTPAMSENDQQKLREYVTKTIRKVLAEKLNENK